MSKVNYNKFNRFDLNEACEHFDCDKQSNWKKINKFIVADGQEYVGALESEFDFEDTTDDEYAAFEAGVKYALSKMNAALKTAGLNLEVAEVDLVESVGFMLVRTDDTPESFVNRVMKKPVAKAEGWL
jgi:hypothetical protein